MTRPEKEVVEQLGRAMKQYPKVHEWIKAWKQSELERLPNVLDRAAVAQGRCQALGDLDRYINEALQQMTAKS